MSSTVSVIGLSIIIGVYGVIFGGILGGISVLVYAVVVTQGANFIVTRTGNIAGTDGGPVDE